MCRVGRLVGRLALSEVRLWVGLVAWAVRRHDGRSVRAFSYYRRSGLQPLLVVGLALVVVEGAAVETVLALVVPHTIWPWVFLGLHVYAVIWLAGFLASLRTRPHLLDQHTVRLRDSVFTEITVPYGAVTGVRPTSLAGFGRSGLVIDAEGQTARLTYGDANVTLSVDPGQPVRVNGRPCATTLESLAITVDDPTEFVRAVNGNRGALHTWFA